jgi:tungstate transport system ATP-binding protein
MSAPILKPITASLTDPTAALTATPIISLIHLDNASVKFGAQTALAPLSMTISQGERVALIGANGSGKSTLLRLLHGQQLPSTGVRVRYTDARQVMVFQQPHMLRLSALINVTLALWFSGQTWTAAKKNALEALSTLGFKDIMHRNARAMSVGQRQRLALVRAWALFPDVLFLDEPTASLDPAARRDIEALIERFAQMGCTLVFSSHNLGQAKRLATRVLYLEQGQCLVDLPKADFFNKELPNEAALFLQGERV